MGYCSLGKIEMDIIVPALRNTCLQLHQYTMVNRGLSIFSVYTCVVITRNYSLPQYTCNMKNKNKNKL